jgi:hypothetical protein
VERFVRRANDYRSKSIATVIGHIDVRRSSVRVVHKRSHGLNTPLEQTFVGEVGNKSRKEIEDFLFDVLIPPMRCVYSPTRLAALSFSPM